MFGGCNKSQYTNKVDIWALGCIFYESVFLRKAFAHDLSVIQYALGEDLWIPLKSETVLDSHSFRCMSLAIKVMLDRDPWKRSRASDIRCRFLCHDDLDSANSNIVTKARELIQIIHDFTKVITQRQLIILWFSVLVLLMATTMANNSHGCYGPANVTISTRRLPQDFLALGNIVSISLVLSYWTLLFMILVSRFFSLRQCGSTVVVGNLCSLRLWIQVALMFLLTVALKVIGLLPVDALSGMLEFGLGLLFLCPRTPHYCF